MKLGPTLNFSPHLTDVTSGGYGNAHLGGFTPDYSGSILGDPAFHQQQLQVAAQNQAAQGTAGSGFGQALAGYGQIPDLHAAAQQLGLDPSSPLYAILTGAASNPNTVQAANSLTQGGLSTEAQLGQQHQTSIDSLMGNLAARGAITSGDTGVGLRNEEQANSQRQYDAQQSLLQHLGAIVGAYNTSQQAGIQQLQTGAAQAAARQIALNPAVPSSLANTLASLASSFAPATGGTPSAATG